MLGQIDFIVILALHAEEMFADDVHNFIMFTIFIMFTHCGIKHKAPHIWLQDAARVLGQIDFITNN